MTVTAPIRSTSTAEVPPKIGSRKAVVHSYVSVGVHAPARGLAISVNLNPDCHCNFDCVYCPVDRSHAGAAQRLDVNRMASELRETLAEVRSGEILLRPAFHNLPPELLELRHVALDGDGEPTLAPDFLEAVESIVHLRAQRSGRFFKLVLCTNGSRLDTRPAQSALEYFTSEDEVWVKLDAGTQEWMDRVNRPDCTLERVLSNIAQVSRHLPVTIQTTLVALKGHAPSATEIGAYIEQLQELQAAHSKIRLVHLHSTGSRSGDSSCRQLPLRQVSEIARNVRNATGLKVEVF